MHHQCESCIVFVIFIDLVKIIPCILIRSFKDTLLYSHGNILDIMMEMFDHVKHVKHWMTMACHIYDSAFY
jgi:hypothetical protein